jgi:hypothetical protein
MIRQKLERRTMKPFLFICWCLLALPAAVQAQFTYTNNGDGTATITGYTGSGGAVTIPSTTNGLTVVSIGSSAFSSNRPLKYGRVFSGAIFHG